MSDSSSPFQLRLATENDLVAINDIYNHYVPVSTANYDYEPWSMEQRQAWFTGREAIHPVTVVTLDSQVVAWGSLGGFRSRIGYRQTVENSLYVHPDFQRQGLGKRLLSDQIERGRQLGVHAIVAVIDTMQAGSIALHQRMGFEEAGRFREIGYKFDRWLDAVFMWRMLE